MKNKQNLSTSRESKANATLGTKKYQREMIKPLTLLCKTYKYNYSRALDAGLVQRLVLTQANGVFYCHTMKFRNFLEEEWDKGEYNEEYPCGGCGKPLPLFSFAYRDDGKLQYECRECKGKRIKTTKQKDGDIRSTVSNKQEELDFYGTKTENVKMINNLETEEQRSSHPEWDFTNREFVRECLRQLDEMIANKKQDS